MVFYTRAIPEEEEDNVSLLQGYGQVVGQIRTNDSDSTTGDSPMAVRTDLSPEETGAIVAALDYLIGNFQHIYGGDASPLYNTSATHTLQ
jgi:hypothetical protein